MSETEPGSVEHIPDGAIHSFFELSYANYLVLPRSLLQSMPLDWQNRFVDCLEQLAERFAGLPQAFRYNVRARDKAGRFVRDPVPHYNRGRTRIVRAERKRGVS